MLEYISYAIFVLSVGLAAFGIMLSTHLRRIYSGSIVSALLYYQIFVFAFGFYGLWGQAVFRIYIDDLLVQEVKDRISTVATLQGFPFLMLAWYMLIRFTRELISRKTGKTFNSIYLISGLIIFGSLIYFISQPDADPNFYYKIYYTVLCLSIQIYASLVLVVYIPGNKRIERRKLFLLSGYITILTLGQVAILNFTDVTEYSALGFMLTFFLVHAGVPVITRYSDMLKPLLIKQEFSGSFDSFCLEFEISPREKEIITEICKGLTNKEISESLFISTQTVKDHTHRIYMKTGARNRVELINRLKATSK